VSERRREGARGEKQPEGRTREHENAPCCFLTY